MRLSVILPCLNGAMTIGEQLEALAAQEWDGDWELIVADNGSTDPTLEILEHYRARLPALEVVDASDRRGAPHAANVGARRASGDALVFVNDDDVVAQGWLAAMGDALRDHELVAGRLEYDRLNEPWAVAVRGRPQEDGLLYWSFGTHLPFGAAAALGVQRSLHERIGGFDEAMAPAGEDMDYCWRAQYAGAQLHFAPGAVTHYGIRHGLRALYRQGRSYGKGNVLVYRKHRALGMPPVAAPWRTAIRAWLAIVKHGLFAADKVQRGRFVWYLGWRVGMLEYSLRYRTVLL